MGALVVRSKELYDRLFFAAKSIGGCPSVFDCYLALRGLKTLEARMKVHCYNAYCIAKYLE
jgi:cystathionine gamma-lyase